MEHLIDILKIILPAGIVFMTAYYLINKFFEQESRKKGIDLKLANQSILTPIRLQAYERVVLFLERINPSSLVMRTNKNNISSSMFQGELIKNIRAEFEHNLSQQIYMSNKSWENVVKAKEETIKLINVASAKVSPDAPAMEMAQAILEVTSQLTTLPTTDAVKLIKKEIAREF